MLVERDDELSRSAAALDAVADGSGRIISVEGPAGMGKTVLLGAIRDQARTRGFRIFSGRGSELEIDFPYGVVRQLFEAEVADEASREVALADAAAPAEAVFGVPTTENRGGEEAMFSALHSLYWMTLNLAGDAPTVLFVDDLHWCDRPSLRFLAYLAHRLDGTRIVLVSGLRSTDPGTDPALVAEIVGGPEVVPVRPGPLSVSAVGEVVESRLQRSADEGLFSACERATGGNPLLLRHLLSALAVEGATPTAATIAEVGPRAVSRTVAQRLSSLPPEATEIARAVAILGDGVAVRGLAELSGHDVAGVARITGTLARAEILRPGAPLGFVHPLVRDAVYEDIPPGERQLQHARAAELIRDGGGSSERVAAQLLAAPPSGLDWVAGALGEAAAEAGAKGAPESVVTYLTRMLEEPLEDSRRPEVELQLALAHAESSGPDAAVHFEAAYETLEDPARRGIAAYGLARTWMFQNEAQRAVRLAEEAVASLPPELADLAAMIESIELTCLYFGAEVPDAADRMAALRSAPAGNRAGESMLAAIAAFDWMVRDGTVEGCSTLARKALESQEMRAYDNGLLWVVATFTLTCAEQPDDLEIWDRHLVESHRLGSSFGVFSVYLWGGFSRLRRGQVAEAEASLRSGIELMELWGIGTLTYAYGFLAMALVEQGRIEEARDALAAFELPPTVDDGTQFTRQAEFEILLAEGNAEEALAVAATYAELAGWRVNPAWAPARSMRARALTLLGRTDEAREELESELEAARRFGAPGLIGRILMLLGEIEPGDSVELLEEAVRHLEDSPSRLDLAKALAALGGRLRRARKLTEARDPLRRAFELSERCGATALAAAIRTELHASGARPRTSALKGPQSLTASELRVAELAAAGQTNKQIAQALFVTPKTIEVHLSNAYRKLEISSRRELEAALAEAP